MIKYNNNTINDWNFDTSNLIKVYRNNAICYYKVSGTPPTPTAQTPCFAVVDDISQYQDTEFDDVFNNADGKWYKLNNLDEYEKYGVYGSGRTITTYEGKLTIDGDYEYIYSGSSWVNLGEISSGTYSYRYWMWRSIGDLGSQNILQFSEFDLVVDGSDASLSLVSAQPTGFSNEGARNLFDNNTSTKYCANFASYKTTNYVLFAAASTISPTVFSMTTANDNASNDRYPREWVLYGSDTSTTNWNDGSWNMVLSGTCGTEMLVNYTRFNYDIWNQAVYPMYYAEMQDPPDNVSFSSMTEAESYECPWWGMTANIDNTDYLFCETNQWLTKYVYQEVSGDYICNAGNKYKKMQEYDRNVDGSTSATTNYVIGDLIESGSTDCSSRLPQGYTEVEYVQNYASISVSTSNLAYINTNFKPNQDTRIVLTMKCDKSNNYSRFCGAGSYDKTNAMQFDYESGAYGTLHISWGAIGAWTTYSNCVGDLNKHEYDWDKNYFYRDKGTANQFSATTTYSNFQCTDNLGIFCNIQNGSGELGNNVLYGSLYSCQIYNNGTLIRDFVPCINPNNVAGVYDIVNDVFYQSANGYSLVAGPIV